VPETLARELPQAVILYNHLVAVYYKHILRARNLSLNLVEINSPRIMKSEPVKMPIKGLTVDVKTFQVVTCIRTAGG
jgi:hypothetical protein